MAPSHEDHAAHARRWRRCQCGAPVQAGANFCPSCGARHFQDSEEGRSHESLVAAGIRCACGVDFAAEDRFCRSCGQERLVGDTPALRRSATYSSGSGHRAVSTLELPTQRRPALAPLPQLRSSPRCPGVVRVSPGRSSPTYSPRMGESSMGCSDSEEESAGGGDSMFMLSSRLSVNSRGHDTEALMLDNEELHEMVRGLQRQLQGCAAESRDLRDELAVHDLLRQVIGFWQDDRGDFYGGACVEFSGNGWRVHENSLPVRARRASSGSTPGPSVYTWKVGSRQIVLQEHRQEGECRELEVTVGGQDFLTVRCRAENSDWKLTRLAPERRRLAPSPSGRASRSPGARCRWERSPGSISSSGRRASLRICSPAASDGEEWPVGETPAPEVEEVQRLRDELAEGDWKLTEAEGCLAQYQEAVTANSELRAALQHEREMSETRLSRISNLEQDLEAFSSWGLAPGGAEPAQGSRFRRQSLAAELASFHGGPGDEEDPTGDMQVELQRLREFASRHEQAAEADCVLGLSAAESRPSAEEEEIASSETEPGMAEVLSLMGQLGQLAGAFQSSGAAPPAAHQGCGSRASAPPRLLQLFGASSSDP